MPQASPGSTPRTVVVYAATTDIGQACVRAFLPEGCRFLLIDDDGDRLDALVADAGLPPSHVATAMARLGVWEDVAAAADAFMGQDRVIDALVTCPMAFEFASIEHSSPEAWTRIVAEDLLGPVFATKAFLPGLRRSGNAAIVHVGSIDGTFGNPSIPSYSTAKGGIVSFTHVSASEFGRFGIRVNSVGRSVSEGTQGMPQAVLDALLPHTPLGRISRVSELAAVVHFLASPAASYLSGVVIPVDGGRTALTAGTRPAEQTAYRA